MAGGQQRMIASSVAAACSLEVEAAAETLAQRQAPGAVSRRLPGTVDNQLHAAGFVEEAFHHSAAGSRAGHPGPGGRGPGTRRSAARRHRPARGWRRARRWLAPAAALPAMPGLRRAARRGCRAGAPRWPTARRCARRLTQPERNVRRLALGVSTRTRPGSMRMIRYEVLPSWNTSPARLSTAKSSLTVPTSRPCGSSSTL